MSRFKLDRIRFVRDRQTCDRAHLSVVLVQVDLGMGSLKVGWVV